MPYAAIGAFQFLLRSLIMDKEKLDYIRNRLIQIQDFLFSQKEDEVPEDCVEDLQAAIDYLNKCPDKLEPNHLPKASIDILKKKHGRNKPTE